MRLHTDPLLTHPFACSGFFVPFHCVQQFFHGTKTLKVIDALKPTPFSIRTLSVHMSVCLSLCPLAIQINCCTEDKRQKNIVVIYWSITDTFFAFPSVLTPFYVAVIHVIQFSLYFYINNTCYDAFQSHIQGFQGGYLHSEKQKKFVFETKSFFRLLTSSHVSGTIIDRFLMKFYIKFTYWRTSQFYFERNCRIYPAHWHGWKSDKIQYPHLLPINYWKWVKNPIRLTTYDPNHVYRHWW